MKMLPATLGASDEHYRRLGVSRDRIEICFYVWAWIPFSRTRRLQTIVLTLHTILGLFGSKSCIHQPPLVLNPDNILLLPVHIQSE